MKFTVATVLFLSFGAQAEPAIYGDDGRYNGAQYREIVADRWYSYQQKPANCSTSPSSHFGNGRVSPPSCFVWLEKGADDYYVSQGPWWIDPNHEMVLGRDGFGHVNVIAFYQDEGRNGILDIRDAEITVDIKNESMRMVEAYSREGLKKSHIYFWFQTKARAIDNCTKDPQLGENCTRQSNYILTANGNSKLHFDDKENSGTVTLTVSDYSGDDWTCLKYGRNIKYDDCLPISEALSTDYSMGFIAAPVNGCMTDKPWQAGGVCDLPLNKKYSHHIFNEGKFEFKNFTVKKVRRSIDIK